MRSKNQESTRENENQVRIKGIKEGNQGTRNVEGNQGTRNVNLSDWESRRIKGESRECYQRSELCHIQQFVGCQFGLFESS